MTDPSSIPMESPFRSLGESSTSSHTVPSDLDKYTKEQLYQLAQVEVRAALANASQREQELRQLQLQVQLAAAASPPSLSPEAIATAFSKALAAQAPFDLPLFDGSGSTSGLAAYSWIQQVERAFEERVSIAGTLEDSRRIHAAAKSLRGGASTWYASLSPMPTAWSGFKSELLNRFQPASALRLIESQLELLVDRVSKFRERLNTQGLERYTQNFQLLANQIPSDRMLERTKVLLFSKALPTRLRELVLVEDEKAATDSSSKDKFTLNIIVDKILRRSATRETASGTAPESGRSTPSEAMDLSAVTMCSQSFGVSMEEASGYFESVEGWVPHDTSSAGSSGSAPHNPSSTPVAASQASLVQQVNALQAQLAAMSRRTVSPPIKKEVPEQLAADRRAAGLCVRCGVAKYEPGGRGHNSRTCQSPPDKTTSAAVGAKKAGLPLFQ